MCFSHGVKILLSHILIKLKDMIKAITLIMDNGFIFNFYANANDIELRVGVGV